MESTTNAIGSLNVFISYSRSDTNFADEIDAGLQWAGFSTIIDRHAIVEGEDWQKRLGELIASADSIVFILSPDSVASKICAWEVEQAFALSKRIIPILSKKTDTSQTPEKLAALNYVRFDEGRSFMVGLKALDDALNSDVSWIREHTRYLTRAREWVDGGRPENRLLFGSDIVDARVWAATPPRNAPALTDLHIEFFRKSERVAEAQKSVELNRLEEIRRVQTERENALNAAEHAVRQRAYLRVWAFTGLVLFSTFSAWQWQRAKNEAQNTQRALAATTSTVNRIVENLSTRYRNQKGVPHSVIKEILADAAKLSRTALPDTHQNINLRIARAAALYELSLTQAELGDLQNAHRSIEEVLVLTTSELPLDSPLKTTNMIVSGNAARLAGNIYLALGKPTMAEKYYRQSIARLDLSSQGRSKKTQISLTKSMNRLGDLELSRGRHAKALSQYSSSRSIAEKLVTSTPQNIDVVRVLVRAMVRQGNANILLGKSDNADLLYHQALEKWTLILKRHPQNLAVKKEVSHILEKSYDLKVSSGFRKGMAGLLTRKLNLARELYNADPQNNVYAADLARSLERKGLERKQMPNQAVAKRFFRQSLELWQELSQRSPNNPDFTWGASVSEIHLSDIAYKQKDKDLSAKLLGQAFQRRRGILKLHQRNNQYRLGLIYVLERLLRRQPDTLSLAKESLPLIVSRDNVKSQFSSEQVERLQELIKQRETERDKQVN